MLVGRHRRRCAKAFRTSLIVLACCFRPEAPACYPPAGTLFLMICWVMGVKLQATTHTHTGNRGRQRRDSPADGGGRREEPARAAGGWRDQRQSPTARRPQAGRERRAAGGRESARAVLSVPCMKAPL